MFFLLQNGTDHLLLQNGTDDLLLQADAVGGLSIPIAAYHYQHHLGSMA